VVATVGTTSSTSVDPVAAIAGIAEKHKLWLHIDAAYAGPAAILPECRYIFEGAERAHSIVLNPHKWMFTPVDLSAFYTRRPDILRRAFSLIPEYLRASEDPRAINMMDYGIPLGRRFRSLKLWFLMRYFGRERTQAILRRHIAWAKQLAETIRRDARFEVVAPVPFSVVCFRYKGSDEENRALLEAVNATREVFLSHTVLNGRIVLRVAIGNLQTTWEDVQRAWELLQEKSKMLA
jgi:aromatic-L-amino-acid decarboxylase